MIRRWMPIVLPPFEDRLRKAVAHYWRTLEAQSHRQKPGMDHGRRSAVTGGKQMDGFCELVDWLLRENGLDEASIYVRSDREIPGFFRPTKEWDMLVVHEGQRSSTTPRLFLSRQKRAASVVRSPNRPKT